MPSGILMGRYMLLPLAGLIAGCGVARWIGHHEHAYDRIAGTRARWILLMLMTASLATMGWMVTVRYMSWHSFVFDLGSYDQKVWLIAQESSLGGMWQQTYKGGAQLSPCGINWYWGICHFQPSLVIPGLIYKIWDSPLVLVWFQVLLVASGVIPVFLLARDNLHSPTAGVLASTLYLLYPAVQYNGALDFRPDHVAIPTMLWAYLLAARGSYLASLGAAALGGLSKETLILNLAFFGLYLAIRHRQRTIGALTFVLGIAAFYFVMFHLLRFAQISEGQFLVGRYFMPLANLTSGLSNGTSSPFSFIQTLSQTHKLLYLHALFIPLALVPFLAVPELIPAVPSLAISLLSANPNHASIEAQYSASIVAPMFAALLVAVARLPIILGRRMAPVSILAGLIVLSAFVSFGLGPAPLSRNFWDSLWGGRWHAAQYLPDRQTIVDQAALLIPTDPKVMLVTQNDVNSGRLAHRYNFFAFPYGIERADYVLLDTARQPYVYWMWDPRRYQAMLRNLRADPAYQVIFDREGVLLFKRRESSSADHGATPHTRD